MVISYDFIAFSSRLSTDTWRLGMKAIQGEVPLDIVLPHVQASSDSDEEIVSVLTTEGTVRESSDGMELYRYLRQLNPKPTEAFGYNEVVIRNIHNRLNTLKVDEELRVQITYTERKGYYTQPPFSYNIKLLGIFGISPTDPPMPDDSEAPVPSAQEAPQTAPEKPVYKTTNTLEKLIAFTRNLQKELSQTQEHLALTIKKVHQLEEERQQLQELRSVVQDILDGLNQLEHFDARIKQLEIDRRQLHDLQQTLRTFLKALNQQTRTSLRDERD